MKATSYFCTGSAESKTVDLSNCVISDYRGFKIAHAVSSYMLIMNGVIVTETVGKKGNTDLADAIIRKEMLNRAPKEIAYDYEFKLIGYK